MDLLEELAAERDIRQLLAKYAQYADDGRFDDWADLFDTNGALVMGVKRVEGRDALRVWLVDVQAGVRMRHLMMNAHVSIESSATARCSLDMVLLRAHTDGWMIMASPRYSDRLVKTAAGWKLLERTVDTRTASVDAQVVSNDARHERS